MDHSPPGSSVPGILQARILEWFAIFSSKGSSRPRDWSWNSCVGGWILYHCATGEALSVQFSSVQSLSFVRLFATPRTATCQASISITNSWSLLKLMSFTESVMPSSHPILCRPLPLLPSTFPSIRVFSNESVLYIRWPKYWSFGFSISPSNKYSGLISFRIEWFVVVKRI